MAHFRSEEGSAYAAAFAPRPDDVFIVTYPKSGTTWMQQIVHALRTGGDMEFEEITLVVPWVEMAFDLGIDLHAPQRALPRAFKSHTRGDAINPGARYIYIVRDPVDVAVSFYRFFEDWIFERGSIDLDTFTREFFLNGSDSGDYWGHLLSWWRRDPTSPTLMLAYEELRADLQAMVHQVGDFIGVHDAAGRARAVELAGFACMSAHREKFDDHVLRSLRDPVCGVPAGGSSNKVDRGPDGGTRLGLSDSARALLTARWQRDITAELGFDDYDALLAALPAERARRLGR
jgi:hypothetical protein